MDPKEQVMTGLWDLFNKRIYLDSHKMKARLGEYTPSEVHCIDAIAKTADPNVTKLADAFEMTRGAISKLTRKLMDRGLVESYAKPGNKKEVLFRLTAEGEAVNRIHGELHREYEARDEAVFAGVTDAQYAAMIDFVTRFNEHLDAEIEKLGADMLREGYDKL